MVFKKVKKDYPKRIKALEEELVRKQKQIDKLKEENMLLLRTALKNKDMEITPTKPRKINIPLWFPKIETLCFLRTIRQQKTEPNDLKKTSSKTGSSLTYFTERFTTVKDKAAKIMKPIARLFSVI